MDFQILPMKCLLVLLLLGLCLATQYVPIPHAKHGLTLGNASAPLHIQAFYDLLCSDSKTADETIQSVIRTNGLSNFKLSYVFVPLPYHVFSFKVHQLFFYLLDTYGAQTAMRYMLNVLKNQDKFMENRWRTQRIVDFQLYLADTVSVWLGIDMVDLTKALRPGSQSDIRARDEWKYAVGSLSVSGTPIFYANGVRIDGAEDWDGNRWVQFISDYS